MEAMVADPGHVVVEDAGPERSIGPNGLNGCVLANGNAIVASDVGQAKRRPTVQLLVTLSGSDIEVPEVGVVRAEEGARERPSVGRHGTKPRWNGQRAEARGQRDARPARRRMRRREPAEQPECGLEAMVGEWTTLDERRRERPWSPSGSSGNGKAGGGDCSGSDRSGNDRSGNEQSERDETPGMIQAGSACRPGDGGLWVRAAEAGASHSTTYVPPGWRV